MHMSYQTADQALIDLANQLTRYGDEVGSRQGERTRELLMQNITLTRPTAREILVPERKASLPAQIAETVWVLSGRNDIDWLEPYLPRVGEFSDDGQTWRGGYGPRLRSWPSRNPVWRAPIDQLEHVVELMERDRGTRRAVINIYDPAIDTEDGLDIPCNNWLSFISRLGSLHMHVAVRSNDLIWGWSGINQFQWSVLQEIVAHILGIDVGTLTFSITSLHVYEKHWAKARKIGESNTRGMLDESPRFDLGKLRSLMHLDNLLLEWVELEEQIRTRAISNYQMAKEINGFPEPMLRSWLRVIAAHWAPEERWLEPLGGTRLYQAALLSPKRKPEPKPEPEPAPTSFLRKRFISYVADLHDEKNAAYGDSWKRRGEMLGIMANIARKVDRLGTSDSSETAMDTAVDLLVYLVKYRLWLDDPASENPLAVRNALSSLRGRLGVLVPALEESIRSLFEGLERAIDRGDSRTPWVEDLLSSAYQLAFTLWIADEERARKRDEALQNTKPFRFEELGPERNATRSWNPDPEEPEEPLSSPDSRDGLTARLTELGVDVTEMDTALSLPNSRGELVARLIALGVDVTEMDTLGWDADQELAVSRWTCRPTSLPKPEFLP